MPNGPWGSTIEREPETPERSLRQRMDALKQANEVRTARAQAKRCWKARRRHPVAGGPLECIADPPADFETMKLIDVLLAIPKVGRVKANKVMAQCRVSPSKTLGGLTWRQRDEIVATLR